MNLLTNEFLVVELGKLGFRGALLSSWNLSWRRALAAVVEPSVSLLTFWYFQSNVVEGGMKHLVWQPNCQTKI